MTGRADRRPGPKTVAFVDESQRGQRYLMAAVAVEATKVGSVRQELVPLRPAGGTARRHFTKESDAQRRKMLVTFRSLPGTKFIVADNRSNASTIDKRRQCLTTVVHELLDLNVARIVLDHIDETQQARDRQALAPLLNPGDVSYSHEVAHSVEPLLWIPDAIAWCAGAKPEWRHQIEGWVTIRVA